MFSLSCVPKNIFIMPNPKVFCWNILWPLFRIMWVLKTYFNNVSPKHVGSEICITLALIASLQVTSLFKTCSLPAPPLTQTLIYLPLTSHCKITHGFAYSLSPRHSPWRCKLQHLTKSWKNVCIWPSLFPNALVKAKLQPKDKRVLHV